MASLISGKDGQGRQGHRAATIAVALRSVAETSQKADLETAFDRSALS